MRINHNIGAMIGQGSIFKANQQLNKSLEKLSTGLRINRASDDAAGLSISENLRSQVMGTAIARRNAQDGISALQIAEGAMNEISSVLQRMRELAVQSSTDTLTSSERVYTNQEYDLLRSEIERISQSTKYNDMELLDGTGFGGEGQQACFLHVGANETTADNEIQISINTMTTDSSGLNIAASTINGQTAATKAIASVDETINTVNNARSNLGAYINRLEHTINNLLNSEHNLQAAESDIRDTDYAIETANFTKHQILVQSATAMLANANMVPQSVLSLLGR